MIIFTAKIDILSSEDRELALNSAEPSKNRISNSLAEVFGEKTNYDSPFFLGASSFGGNEKFTNENIDGEHEKEYFVSEVRAGANGDFVDANGDFSAINIIASDETQEITSVTIAFDTENNRHPNKITVDGVEYVGDSSIFTITGLTPQATHSIVIDNWNTPNYPLVITGIYSSISIEIDRRNLISLETSLYDRGDLKLPEYGVISNKGNIEFLDADGRVREFAERLLLQSGLKCEIYLKNTLCPEATKQVAVYETDSWAYDNENRKVSVSLKDDLEEWQDISVEEISYDARNPVEQPLKFFYEYLYDITARNGNYKMQSYDELDEKTKAVLRTTIIKYPLLKAGFLWGSWDKVCQVGQLHIYKENGIVKCRYNGGN